MIEYLVTDRTGEDVKKTTELLQTPIEEWEGVSRVGSAVVGLNKAGWRYVIKGAYTSADFNRVSRAVHDVAQLLITLGYKVSVTPNLNWTDKDVLRSKDTGYLNDLRELRRQFLLFSTTPPVPKDMDHLVYTEANDIEKLLVDLYLLANNILAGRIYYSGDLYAGEV